MSIVGTVARRLNNLRKPTAFRAASPVTSILGLRRISKGGTTHDQAIAANLAERLLAKRVSLTRLLDFDVENIAAPAINQAYQKQPITLTPILRNMIVDLITEKAVSYWPKVIEKNGEIREEIVHVKQWLLDDLICLLGQIEKSIRSIILADAGNRLNSWAQLQAIEVDHRTEPPTYTYGSSPALEAEIAKIIREL